MKGSWTTDLKLVAIEGDVEPGMTIPLDPERQLQVGRSSKGLQLTDPLVSIRHATIEFDARRGYVVTDLDSATGTWVDEELIQNASRPIGIGTRLRFGDTHFELQVRRRFPIWLTWVMAGAVVLCFLAVVLWLFAGTQPPRTPLLAWDGPIRQSATFTSDLVEVPPTFARERGLRIRDLRIRRVTDRDYDGLDEIWIRDGTRKEYIITFKPDGTWVELGVTPQDCHDQASGAGVATDGFPALDCAGVTYMMIEGVYRPAAHEGVVVWTRSTPAPAGAESEDGEEDVPNVSPQSELRPLRVVLREPGRLAGMLSERGIAESIHYIICEDAFPGIRSQVLTTTGQVRTLTYGCVGGLALSDADQGRPVAVALTAAGREALLADLATFYGGSAEGVFLEDDRREVLEQAERSPGYQRGAVKLTADASPVFVNPVAQERPLGTGRALVPRDARHAGSTPATVATITSEGVADLDPPGCVSLRVRTEDFACSGFCSGGTPFLTVDEVGCGEPRQLLVAPYGPGVTDAEVEGLQIRAVIDSSRVAGRPIVSRARVAWRQKSR